MADKKAGTPRTFADSQEVNQGKAGRAGKEKRGAGIEHRQGEVKA